MNPRTLFLERGRTHWPRVLLVSLAGVLVLALGIYASTSATAFAPYNPTWDGTSEFRGQLEDDPTTETQIVTDTAEYDTGDPSSTVAFVIAPDDSYDERDVDRIEAFLERGGTLVVLENFGASGDALLAGLEAEARLDGRLLYDERQNHRGATMPVATNVSDHPSTEAVGGLTLNYASVVEPGDATVLISTSEYAYLGDETTTLEDVETLESYPVATVEDRGSGQLVVISDPSLVINAMIDEPDNAGFVTGLVGDNERVLIDASKTDDVPPIIAVLLTLRGSPLAQVLLGLGAVGTLVALRHRDQAQWASIARALHRNRSPSLEDDHSIPRLTAEERVAYLRRRYPEWDEQRVQRVAKASHLDRSDGESNP
ncbi:DUF4350 domain-containing protein [Halobacteria archaeon AArc-curdl1]|uniref:DUF4350 domain-containing protein n=1 Tax=Natronosalvus hydrolyticus TaxID=2979988 RepID=A0AAP3E9F4_9EURY|nr:DUF4350 domain-containing protein [Halobacteria archaeon AArc-curdl1]